MVMPLIAHAVGHAPCCAHHVSHPSPVPWSCTLLPACFIAHALHCPHPSLPAPFVAHTLCCPCPLSPTPFVTHAVCRATRCPCRVSHPLPVPWSCTSLHALCVTPLVACTMCRACCPCCGHAPCRACHV